MSDTVIKVENLGKKYIIDHQSKGGDQTFRDMIVDNVKGVFTRGKAAKGDKQFKLKEEFWALKNIDFEIKAGDRVGIIGRNGAGKSTLLKILSRITEPTNGRITIRGRVASLLEVGTGFHPELTGRENIFLNGAILGMNRIEIRRKFDEIVAFAEVERFLDTPVKRYSSGMYVRLAFAVAAHLEPEILIVDEVLAVGDAQFQKKCLGKMSEVSQGGGRTVLFVSHNMASIRALCTKGILLKKGVLDTVGDIAKVAHRYIDENLASETSMTWTDEKPLGNDDISMRSINITPINGEELNVESGMRFLISFVNRKPNINLAFSMMFYSPDNVLLFETGVILSQDNDSKIGEYRVECTVPPYLLNAGFYKINLMFGENQKYVLFKCDEVMSFELQETYFDRGTNLESVPGIIRPKCTWKKQLINELI